MNKNKQNCIRKLEELTGKNNVFFTERGNKSILYVLKLMKTLGKKNVIIQDQGGWLTYRQFAEKLKLSLIELKTDYGLINITDLKNRLNFDSVLLINSMPAYAFLENMKEVSGECKKNNITLINDASGSVGRKEATLGDITFGSFGEWKPIELKHGGFLATNNEEYSNFFKNNFKEAELDFEKLLKELENLEGKIAYFNKINKKIKQELKEFDIIHRDKEGINVIIQFKAEQEKEKLINYCNTNKYEFTLCPRYIRVLENAVCIEIKRIGKRL